MEWVKKHTDTVIVLGGILASVFWMNGRFNQVDARFHELEKEVAVIKTVLVVRGIMPTLPPNLRGSLGPLKRKSERFLPPTRQGDEGLPWALVHTGREVFADDAANVRGEEVR